MIIYKVTNKINGKIYVGQTTRTLQHRKTQHICHAKNGYIKSAFANALNKYGPENFTWEIIDTAETIEKLNEKEIYWIAKLESLVDFGHGYNCDTGGKNGKHSEATKKLISEIHSKPVINLTTGKRYKSAVACADDLGYNHVNVSAVCRGIKGSLHKQIFRYLDKDGNIIEPEILQHPREDKEIYNVDTMEKFDTFVDAEESLGNKRTACSNLTRKLKKDKICWHRGQRWCMGKENIEAAKKLIRPAGNRAIRVIDKTNNIVYNSIRSTGYPELGKKLKEGNGKCEYLDREWEYL